MELNENGVQLFGDTYIKMFFLLAPFFTMTLFLKMAEGLNSTERRRAAMRASVAVLISISAFYFFGGLLFGLLGVTLAAFQIGAGTTLFLTSVMLVLGISKPPQPEEDADFAVVPLALPLIVGPGAIGTLMVWGTQITEPTQRMVAYGAIFSAGITMMLFLLLAEHIQKIIGRKTLSVMTKVTALVLTALAAQIVFTGIKNFMAA